MAKGTQQFSWHPQASVQMTLLEGLKGITSLAQRSSPFSFWVEAQASFKLYLSLLALSQREKGLGYGCGTSRSHFQPSRCPARQSFLSFLLCQMGRDNDPLCRVLYRGLNEVMVCGKSSSGPPRHGK